MHRRRQRLKAKQEQGRESASPDQDLPLMGRYSPGTFGCVSEHFADLLGSYIREDPDVLLHAPASSVSSSSSIHRCNLLGCFSIECGSLGDCQKQERSSFLMCARDRCLVSTIYVATKATYLFPLPHPPSTLRLAIRYLPLCRHSHSGTALVHM